MEKGFEQSGWAWVTMVGPDLWKLSSPVLETEQAAEQYAGANIHWNLLNNFTQQRLIQVSVFEGSAVVQ